MGNIDPPPVEPSARMTNANDASPLDVAGAVGVPAAAGDASDELLFEGVQTPAERTK